MKGFLCFNYILNNLLLLVVELIERQVHIGALVFNYLLNYWLGVV